MEKTMLIKKYIKENKKDLIIILIYAILTFIVTIFFHEKWRDEAQAWLLARDLNPIELLKQMKYEGHPPLWHLILMPFAKLGFPYITISIISWGIMCVSSWILLRKSPFKQTTKILILFSAPFIYFYPTISRNYCLIPLAISIIASIYPNRNEKKIQYVLSVLFLAYTHVLMLGLVGILYLFFFLEQLFYTKKNKKEKQILGLAIAIALIGLLCLVAMLFGSIGTNNDISTTNNLIIKVHSGKMFVRLVNLYVKNIKALIRSIECGIVGAVGYTSGFNTICFIAIIAIFVFQIKVNKKNGIILVVSCLWQMAIYLFVYSDTSGQKINTMFLIFIFIAWINLACDRERVDIIDDNFKKYIMQFCIFIVILSDICGLTNIQTEIKQEYSDSKNVANYINQNLDEDSIIVCTNCPTVSAIIPYIKNAKFWNPFSKQYFSYITWKNDFNTDLKIDEIINNIKEKLSLKNVYLLESYEHTTLRENPNIIKLIENGTLSEELYSSNEFNEFIMFDEVYKLYKVNL